MTVRAYLTPVWTGKAGSGDHDGYRYDIEALNHRLERELYPVNRMCRVLHEHGHGGPLNVYATSPSTGEQDLRLNLRLTGDITAMAAAKLTEESRDGLQRVTWRPADVENLLARVQRPGIRPVHSDSDLPPTDIARNDNLPPAVTDTGQAA